MIVIITDVLRERSLCQIDGGEEEKKNKKEKEKEKEKEKKNESESEDEDEDEDEDTTAEDWKAKWWEGEEELKV